MAEAAVNAPSTPSVAPHAETSRPRAAPAATKHVADLVATLFVLPWLIGYRLGIRLLPARTEMLFQGYSQSLSARPGISGIYLRRAFYRRTLKKCGRDFTVGFGTTFAVPDIEVGNAVTISNFCNIGQVSIGDDAMISSNVHILSGRHQHNFDRLDVPLRHQGGHRTPIRIGRDVWIGNHAVVTEDIGDQAIVAAGSVVTRTVPPRSIMAGNPARLLAERGARRASSQERRDSASP